MSDITDDLRGKVYADLQKLQEALNEYAGTIALQVIKLRYGIIWSQKCDDSVSRAIGALEDISLRIENLHENASAAEQNFSMVEESFGKRLCAVRVYDEHKLTDPTIRDMVWEMTDGKCAYCGDQTYRDQPAPIGKTFCVEHVVPRRMGGPDHISNYVPSCTGCNSSKCQNHVLDFVQRNIQRLRGAKIKQLPANVDLPTEDAE